MDDAKPEKQVDRSAQEHAMREVEAALKRHGCMIVTFIRYAATDDGRGIVDARWAVVPRRTA